jgi:hypothetical protein
MNHSTVVILLSDKRSGSTMLQRELCKHPEIQTVAYSPHTYLETHHWLKGAVLLGMPPETFAGGKVYTGYGSRENARTYLIDCIKGNVPGFQIPDEDRALIFDGWDALCDKFAQPVFFEKSPQLLGQWSGLMLLLEWIYTTDFRVKIIGLTRNPLSVQYSAFQLFHTNPVKRQYSWLEGQKNMLAFRCLLPAGNFYHLRYENIIEQPEATFCELCNFLEISECAEMGKTVHKESLTKWRDDAYFTLQLDRSVKQMAKAFGYSEEELENPHKLEHPLSYCLAKKAKELYNLTIARFRNRFLKPAQLWLNWIFNKKLRPGK